MWSRQEGEREWAVGAGLAVLLGGMDGAWCAVELGRKEQRQLGHGSWPCAEARRGVIGVAGDCFLVALTHTVAGGREEKHFRKL